MVKKKIKRLVQKIRSSFSSPATRVICFVILFAIVGTIALLVSRAATGNVAIEVESGTTDAQGVATRVTGDSSASGNSYVKFGLTPATFSFAPGISISWGSNTLANSSYVNGGQIVLNWPEIEPQKGVFCWDDPRVGNKGCGSVPYVSNTAKGLSAQLAYIKSIGKYATVQVNSTNKPSWIYSNGVELCGYQKQLIYSQLPDYDIPMYWQADGSPNPTYFGLMQTMLTSFATAIRGSSNKSVISAVRTSPNLVGTEFAVADPTKIKVGGPITLTTPNCSAQSAWTPAVGNQAYAHAAKLNYNVLEPDIRPVLRMQAFTTLGPYNLDPNTYLLSQPGKIQPWFFVTSASADASFESKNAFPYTWAKSGQAIGYEEQVIDSASYQHPVSWHYWTVLMQLDKAISYLATFGKDVTLAQTNTEYRSAYDFANTYAGFNSSQMAPSSPGAWIAFAPTTSETTRALTKGNFSMFMVEDSTSDGSKPVDSLGTLAGGCFLDTANTSCAGVNPIGDATQRYGRWARRTDIAGGHPNIRLSLDPTFKSSLSGNVKAYFTYLDTGNGTVKLDWGGGSSATFTKTGSNRWITTPVINIPVSQITKTVNGNDFGLSVTGSDTTFHMLEVKR